MKTQIKLAYFGVICSLLVIAIISSCLNNGDKASDATSIPPIVLDQMCPECKSHAFWLPAKTTIEKFTTKDGIEEIIITAPEDYIYYGLTIDSALIQYESKAAPSGNSVTVTCKCTDGDLKKCNPIGNNGQINCVVQAGCTTCERIEKVKDPITKSEFEILAGGFVKPSLGVSFALEDEELPYAFESLLFYTEVNQQLENFMLNFYSSIEEIPQPSIDGEEITAPEGFRFAVLNVYGRALITLIPDNKNIKSVGGYTYKCPCSGTAGKCKVKSSWGYYFCEKDGCTEPCNTMIVEDKSYLYYFY